MDRSRHRHRFPVSAKPVPTPPPQAHEPPEPSQDDVAPPAAAPSPATLYRRACRYAAAHANAELQRDHGRGLSREDAVRRILEEEDWSRFGGDAPEAEDVLALMAPTAAAPSCAPIDADACLRAAAFADAAMRRDKGGTLTAAEAARQAAARMAARGEAVVRPEDVLTQMSMCPRPRRPLPGVAAFTDAMLVRDDALGQTPAEPADTPDAPTAGQECCAATTGEERPFCARVRQAARRARAALGMSARPFEGLVETLIPLGGRSDSEGQSFLEASALVSFVDLDSGSYGFRSGVIEDYRKPVFVAMLKEIYGECVLPEWLTNSRSIFLEDVDRAGVCAPFAVTIETEQGRQVVKASMVRQGATLYFWLDDPNPLRLD